VPDDFFARAVRHAKRLGAKTVADTAGPGLKAALAEGVTLMKPNLVELSDFVGGELDNESEQLAACRKLIADRRAEMVALTLGEDGALLVTREQAWRAQPLAIEAVSTVGAGDSFLGGLVSALAAGKTLEDAFRIAVAAASAAVLTPGTGLCQPQDVKSLLPKVRIREVAEAI
jgi:6-phosphofructokinase 2